MNHKKSVGHGVHLTPRKAAGVLVAVGALVLTGCGAQNSAESQNDKPTVLTTFTVLADMAQNVAGDHIKVESLTKPGAEIHEYEPTPSDVAKAQDADLILTNGMGLEAWLNQFTEASGARSITVSQGVEQINIKDGEAKGHANPHAWMSPVNAEIYVDNMAHAFAELDPDHAQDYQDNANNYKQQLQEISGDLEESLKGIPQDHKTLVTCEGAFSYLAKEAGLQEEYLWAVNSDEQVSAQKAAEVTEAVKSKQVPAVFCESTVNDSTMQQVASDTGAEFGGALYVDSLSEPNGDVPTYLDLLRYDTQLITRGLAGK